MSGTLGFGEQVLIAWLNERRSLVLLLHDTARHLLLVLFLWFFLPFFNPFIHIEKITTWPGIFHSITVEDIQEVGAYCYSMLVIVDVY